MNVCERIFADIRCTLMYQRMIGVVCVVKSMDAQKRGGPQGEREKDSVDFYSRHRDGELLWCDTFF